tara:strand:+ start:262 stop:1407 length:1146 start_codon:yes stop_codon:yes gene_type:complete
MVQAAAQTLVYDALAAGLDIYTDGDKLVETTRSKIDGTCFTQEFLDSMATPSANKMEKMLQRMVGSCDIAFRSSVCMDECVTKYAQLLNDARSCRHDAISTSEDASCYGVRRNIQSYAKQLNAMYAKVGRMTQAIFDMIKSCRFFTHAPPFSACHSNMTLLPACKTVVEGIERLRAALQQKSTTLSEEMRLRIIRYMMVRHATIETARTNWLELQEHIDAHVNLRSKSAFSWLSIESIGFDLLAQLMQFVDFRSASMCLQTCKEFSKFDFLKDRLPHLSVRWDPGVFPHVMAPSIETGECGYIASNTLVHLYTDFVITGIKRTDPASVRIQTTPTEKLDGAREANIVAYGSREVCMTLALSLSLSVASTHSCLQPHWSALV